MSLVLLLLTGLLIGWIAPFFGIGGGFVIILLLNEIFPGIPPQIAIACSVGVICLKSTVNCLHFARAGLVPDWKLAIPMGGFLAIGVSLGAILTNHLSPELLKTLFALALVGVALKTLLLSPVNPNSPAWSPPDQHSKRIWIFLFAILGGLVSGVTGLGGGLVMVPVLLSLAHAPINWIPPYTNVAMSIGGLAGIICFALANAPAATPDFFAEPTWRLFQFGQLNLGISATIFIGSLFSARWGLRLGQRASTAASRWSLAILFFLLAGRILFERL